MWPFTPSQFQQLLTQTENIMAAIDDLKAEVVKLTTAVTAASAQLASDFAALQAVLQGNDDPAVEAAVAAMDAQITALNTAVAAATPAAT